MTFDELQRVRIHAGTIVAAIPNARARVPAYALRIDFGPLGSANELRAAHPQLRSPTISWGARSWPCSTFPRNGSRASGPRCLVPGTVSEDEGVVLLQPTFPVANGAPGGLSGSPGRGA